MFTKQELELIVTLFDKVPLQGVEMIMVAGKLLEKCKEELQDAEGLVEK